MEIVLEEISWRLDSEDIPEDQILSQPISWILDEDTGLVKFRFVFGYSDDNITNKEYIHFDPNNLRNGYETLGAIYTFLNREEVSQIYILEKLRDKEEILEFFRQYPTGPYYRIMLIQRSRRNFQGLEFDDDFYRVSYG